MTAETDVFMQVIVDKQRDGEPLTHLEIELLRQRDAHADLDAKIDTLHSDVRELLQAWRDATGTLRVIKFLSKWGAIIGGLLALFKIGAHPGDLKP